MRWLIVFIVAFVLFNGLVGWLHRFGLGRLPGDFSFRDNLCFPVKCILGIQDKSLKNNSQ